MCSRAKCRNCKKITWSGCGAHVNEVLAGVPRDQRCDCNTKAGRARAAAAAAGPVANMGERSFFGRLFGR